MPNMACSRFVLASFITGIVSIVLSHGSTEFQCTNAVIVHDTDAKSIKYVEEMVRNITEERTELRLITF